MAGVSIVIEVAGGESIASKLRELRDVSGNMKGALTEIGQRIEAATRRRFETKVGPDGQSWAPLAASTLKRRRGRGMGILVLSGALTRSIFSRLSDGHTVEIGSDGTRGAGKYAAIHQLGGKAGRGLQTTIPARPFIGISKSDEEACVEIVNEYLTEALAR